VSVLARGWHAGAYTYMACPNATAEGLGPFDWYLAYVLAGARRHGFPVSYIQTLLNIKYIADRNTARAAENYRVMRSEKYQTAPLARRSREILIIRHLPCFALTPSMLSWFRILPHRPLQPYPLMWRSPSCGTPMRLCLRPGNPDEAL
jgi:hypothetical protein